MKGTGSTSAEAGYNLVILMVAITVLNILLAIALPKWSYVIRHDREEELISRGWQYAEAVRIFQIRFQRPPVRIEELIEVEPRSIRKLWKDPMTEDGKWALIPQGEPPSPSVPPLDPNGRSTEDTGETDEDNGEEIDSGGIGEKKGIVQIGPFSGVHSRSSKESILIFNGHTRYDEWHFTVEMINQLMAGGPPPGAAGVGGFAGGDPNRIPNLSTRWLGRPLPAFLQIPQGELPGGLGGDPGAGKGPGSTLPRRINPRGNRR